MNIIELMQNSNDYDVSIDLCDINRLLKHHGYAYINEKRGQIDNVFKEIFGNIKIKNPKGIIFYYKINKNVDIITVDKLIEEYLGDIIDDEDIDVLQGMYTDNSLADEEIILGCIFTGMEE